MRTAIVRYKGLGLLLLGAVGALAAAWLLLSHVMFAVAAVIVIAFAMLSMVLWDGMHQSSLASLSSRGIFFDSHQGLQVTDPGLRKDWAPAVGRRASGNRVRRQTAPSAVRSRPQIAPAIAGPRSGGSKSPRSGQSRRRSGTLQPDAAISLAGERTAAGIDDLFAALNAELIGLVPVKKKIEEIGSLLLVDRARQRFGLSASRPNLHMCFTGPPGTGKTTVALMMADLLNRLGYLEKNHVVHAMRDDLVGEYIGHTAPKTKAVLDRAMGGVLFIDEAYTLYRGMDSKDYGQECIDILMQVMENSRDRLVVILAGYRDRMDDFFESNPGMVSRIAHHLDFAAYELDELLAIGGLMLDRSSYYLSAEAEETFRDCLALEMTGPRFANARSVRNALEGARLRHAFRLAAEPERYWRRDDLMRLEAPDILGP